jgi:hypothetical protein
MKLAAVFRFVARGVDEISRRPRPLGAYGSRALKPFTVVLDLEGAGSFLSCHFPPAAHTEIA